MKKTILETRKVQENLTKKLISIGNLISISNFLYVNTPFNFGTVVRIEMQPFD